MGFSNCTRVLVYSAVSSNAAAQAPASNTQSAVMPSSVMKVTMASPSAPGPPIWRSVARVTADNSTMASGRPVVVVCRVRVTPSASASTMKTPTPPRAPSAPTRVAGTRVACATSAAGQDEISRQFGQGGGQDRVAGTHPGQPAGPLLIGAELGDRRRSVDHGLHHGDVGGGSAGGFDHQAGGDEIEAGPADILAQGDPDQPGLSQLVPKVAVDRAFVLCRRLDVLEPLMGGALAENPASQLPDGFLLFAVTEIHVSSASVVSG